jgi:hypothetical protein
VPVVLRAIAGHRDTGFTDCPGNALYAELPQVAKEVAALGGPKIYAPAVARNGEGQTRFTAQLSGALPWTITIVSSSGQQVAQSSGTGQAVDWTWDGAAAPSDRYTWTIASPNARPATGVLGATTALALQKVAAAPAQVGPAESTTISYTLTTAATVTLNLLSPTGAVLSSLLTAPKPAGAQSLAFTPLQGLANGAYTVALSAVSGAKTVSASIPLVIDDVLTGVTSSGPSLSFTLTRLPLSLSFQVLRGKQVVATPAAPLPAIGPQTLTWDGLTADGARATDGVYTLTLTIADDVATFTRTFDVTLDRKPPVVTPLSYRNLRFRVSEAATLTLVVGTQRFTRVLHKPATTQFWLKKKPLAYRLVVTDLAGNSTAVRYRR